MGAVRVESFGRTSARSWNIVKARIDEIESECFAEGAFAPDELRRAFNKPRNVAVLLWDGPLLIGYTQAEPRGRGTYYIANTAIAKSHQRRGLVKLLMQRLYDDMRAAGARFIERDAAIANGYADAVVRAHGPDIVETFDHDSEYGPQRFIRMRVPAA